MTPVCLLIQTQNHISKTLSYRCRCFVLRGWSIRRQLIQVNTERGIEQLQRHWRFFLADSALFCELVFSRFGS